MADSEEEFRAVCRDEGLLRPGVEELCWQLGVDTGALSRFPGGSRPVYAAGDLVLKLFPPVDLTSCRVEANVLAAVEGMLPTPTPPVHSAGEHDGWGYVLMGRLPGVPLETVWDRFGTAERDHLAARLGETIAALHRVPPPAFGWWPDDWPAFVAGQCARCVDEQLGLGLAPAWAEQIGGFLDGVALSSGPLVLLHTEIMSQHLLVAQSGAGSWRLSGLFDFEPAMHGAREYEFAAVAVFIANGDNRFLRGVLAAYGYTDGQLGRDLSRRLFAWLLLHRYSNLASYLQRLPRPARPTLDALAERWFGT